MNAYLPPLLHVSVLETVRQPLDTATGQAVCVYAECLVEGEVYWGVGIAGDPTRALVDAVLSAAHRHVERPVRPRAVGEHRTPLPDPA
jgi:hypothetical protein